MKKMFMIGLLSILGNNAFAEKQYASINDIRKEFANEAAKCHASLYSKQVGASFFLVEIDS